MPDTQVPDPVQPVPPHCEYLGKVPAAVVALADDVVPVEVARVDDGVVVVPPEPPEELTTTPPGPATDVVKDPLSIYTPLK